MCAVCRRNLLAGESYRRFLPPPGRVTRAVCALCEPRAAAEGWERAQIEHEREGAGGLRSTVRLVA